MRVSMSHNLIVMESQYLQTPFGIYDTLDFSGLKFTFNSVPVRFKMRIQIILIMVFEADYMQHVLFIGN